MRITFLVAVEAYKALSCTWHHEVGTWAVLAHRLFVHVAARVGWTAGAVLDLLLRSTARVGPTTVAVQALVVLCMADARACMPT